jgi:hypothetical protein
VLQFNIQVLSQSFQPHKWSFLETGLTNLKVTCYFLYIKLELKISLTQHFHYYISPMFYLVVF